MRSVITILLLFFVQVSVSFAGNIFDSSFKVHKDTNLIRVYIIDSVIDGCWTNILESKTYAEDKLTLLGANIVNKKDFLPMDWEKGYFFAIHVGGRRIGSFCSGNISIEMYTTTLVNGKVHQAKVFEDSWFTVQKGKLNNDVLSAVGQSIKKLN